MNSLQAPPTSHESVSAAPAGSDKILAILSHLSAVLGAGILLPLVVYLVMREHSEYVSENAREALNFHISVLIYCLCCVPLIFVVIGFPLLIAIGVASLVSAIIGTIRASNGVCYRYPLTFRLV